MQSTIPRGYSKQADINQPHHVTPRVTSFHPAIMCPIRKEQIGRKDVLNSCSRRFSRQRVITRALIKSTFAPEDIFVFRPVTLLPEWKARFYLVDIGHCAAMMNRTPSHSDYLCILLLHRLYFTLKKKAPAMSVTVSPCDSPIEWSLAARTLKDKPLKSLQCEGMT